MQATNLPWANLLTGARLVMAGPCAWAIYTGHWWLAASLFTLAAFSDYFDGRIARATNQQSNFGGLFDHATDALFVSSALWSLSQQQLVTAGLPIVVVAAFIQYSLDSKALAGAQLRANWLGRSNGIAYFVLVGVAIGWQCLGWSSAWLWPVSLVLVATTALSMANRAQYWWRHQKAK